MKEEDKPTNAEQDSSPLGESWEEVELRSESVKEILGRPPRWITRWGITVVFIIVAGLFIGSYFFKYPEIVTAQIIVTTENLPVHVVAKTSGRIDTLFVYEKQEVEKNQLLAVIENPARVFDIFALTAVLEGLEVSSDNLNMRVEWPTNLRLGAIQSSYNHLLKAYEDYRYFLRTDYHRNKIAVIEKQIQVQTTLLVQSRKQLSLAEEQNRIAKRLFETDSILAAERLIAPIEYDKAKSTLLQQYQGYESAKSNYEGQKMSILQLDQAVFDLEQQRTEQLTQLRLALTTTYDQLQAELKAWEQSYLFRSPIAGTVTFTKFWQSNQNINPGEALLTIVPGDTSKITGKIYLPAQGAGKVKVGQRVNVKLDKYPYMEYGMVKVFIKNIALVPLVQNEIRNYVLEVEFPGDLTTNYGKILTFTQEMQGTAEIVTEDLRLLDRFLRPIRALLTE